MRLNIKNKWRPPLWLVVATVIGLVLCLPLAGLFLFNFYSKQLVQQTEEALIAQASVLSAIFAEEFKREGGLPEIGKAVPVKELPQDRRAYRPIFPKLSVRAGTISPPRPDPIAGGELIDPVYSRIGRLLTTISVAAQDRTLAGFRLIDPSGTVIGGTAEVGTSLAHITEVETALSGLPTTLLRQRDPGEPYAMPWSLNRSTNFRVFVALPVTVEKRVIGAVYLSRTPGNIIQYMFLERANLFKAGAAVLAAALFIGFVFWRFITRPIYGLISQTYAVSKDSDAQLSALPHYGTREVAKLGQSFMTMADALKHRAESVETFTAHVSHELKSPLTSILGAAELLREGNVDTATEKKFLNNIADDAERMTVLLDRLRRLASARKGTASGRCELQDVKNELLGRFEQIDLKFEGAGSLPISSDDLIIVLTHMMENSVQHNATKVEVTKVETGLVVKDDGSGISVKNQMRIFDPFFTTRREAGGTGMGLGIVAALLEANKGHVELLDTAHGAAFSISFEQT